MLFVIQSSIQGFFKAKFITAHSAQILDNIRARRGLGGIGEVGHLLPYKVVGKIPTSPVKFPISRCIFSHKLYVPFSTFW